jgi:hypothetical protein
MNQVHRFLLKGLFLMALPLVMAFSAIVFAGAEKQWQFRVFLDDREIGMHTVKVKPYKDLKQVSVDADFKVKFLFFTAFSYQHHTEEVWKGSCLTDIQSTTNNNGEKLFVRKQSGNANFKILTHAGEQNLQGCVRSFAYWDLALLKADKLLNTQTGEYESVEVIEMGNSSLDIDGEKVEAVQYRLSMEDKSVDLWYSQDRQWLALKSETEDGYQISYYPETRVF